MSARWLLAGLVFLVAGCAQAPSTAPTLSEAGIGTPDQDSGILVVYRELVPPVAYTVSVLVNGQRVASLPNDAYTFIRVPPGDHEVRISWPALAMTPGRKTEAAVAAGEHVFVAFTGRTDAVLFTSPESAVPVTSQLLAVVPPAPGLDRINRCCRHVPALIQDLENHTGP